MIQPDVDQVWIHNRFSLSSLCFRSGSLTALSAVSSPLYFILMWLRAEYCSNVPLVISSRSLHSQSSQFSSPHSSAIASLGANVLSVLTLVITVISANDTNSTMIIYFSD